MIKDGCKMKLTFDERMLMTLYNTGTRCGTINNLKNMRMCISQDEDETFLRNLTDSVLSKLDLMTEDEFEDAIFKGLEDINAD